MACGCGSSSLIRGCIWAPHWELRIFKRLNFWEYRLGVEISNQQVVDRQKRQRFDPWVGKIH